MADVKTEIKKTKTKRKKIENIGIMIDNLKLLIKECNDDIDDYKKELQTFELLAVKLEEVKKSNPDALINTDTFELVEKKETKPKVNKKIVGTADNSDAMTTTLDFD